MSDAFDPAQADGRAFRDALGQFGTGVTVVTCLTADGAPLGITANSFSSVSLDPPLVLWSPAKASSRYPHYMAAQHFAVHVIGQDNFDIAKGFAKSGDAFDTIEWTRGDHGVPLIGGCLACFECTTTATHDGGDHSIVVARVRRVTTQEGKPLLFFGGAYGTFATD